MSVIGLKKWLLYSTRTGIELKAAVTDRRIDKVWSDITQLFYHTPDPDKASVSQFCDWVTVEMGETFFHALNTRNLRSVSLSRLALERKLIHLSEIAEVWELPGIFKRWIETVEACITNEKKKSGISTSILSNICKTGNILFYFPNIAFLYFVSSVWDILLFL